MCEVLYKLTHLHSITLNAMIDRIRQVRDRAHPIYAIMDRSSSSSILSSEGD